MNERSENLIKPMYMVTIRKSQVLDHVTMDMLDRIFNTIVSPLVHSIICFDYELDPKYKQLHLHALCQLNYSKRPNHFDGFFIHYEKVKSSISTAIDYIHKNEFECHVPINYYQSSSLWA